MSLILRFWFSFIFLLTGWISSLSPSLMELLIDLSIFSKSRFLFSNFVKWINLLSRRLAWIVLQGLLNFFIFRSCCVAPRVFCVKSLQDLAGFLINGTSVSSFDCFFGDWYVTIWADLGLWAFGDVFVQIRLSLSSCLVIIAHNSFSFKKIY